MPANSEIARELTESLGLNVPPVAITFADERPAGPAPDKPVPAGCSFWELGARGTVHTSASDHQHCAIGVHTHNLRDAVASHGAELEAALGAMTGLGYVTSDEVAGIPVMRESHGYVSYGPLAETDGNATVVLIVANAAQSLTLTEAAARVDGTMPPAMGRPACALVPQVANSGAAAASLGCCGARAYVDSLAKDIVLWAFPGERMADYVAAIDTLASANSTLTQFHTARRQAIESGATPTVNESLNALG